MADDVARLLDHLRLGRVTLLGHSLGGVAGYLIAERRPALVSRLIVEDVSPPFDRNRPTPDRPEGELGFDWGAALALRSEADRYDEDQWRRLAAIAAPTLLIGAARTARSPWRGCGRSPNGFRRASSCRSRRDTMCTGPDPRSSSTPSWVAGS
jgi:pimeloyl-ACP methyl ester carboxylesterase